MMPRVYVIETIDRETEWGIGIDSPNPDRDHYFRMASERDAVAMKNLLDASDMEVRRIWQIARDGYNLMDDETSWAQLTGYPERETEHPFACNHGMGEGCQACV